MHNFSRQDIPADCRKLEMTAPQNLPRLKLDKGEAVDNSNPLLSPNPACQTGARFLFCLAFRRWSFGCCCALEVIQFRSPLGRFGVIALVRFGGVTGGIELKKAFESLVKANNCSSMITRLL